MKIGIKSWLLSIIFLGAINANAQTELNIKLSKKEAKKVHTLDSKDALSLVKYYLSSRILENTNYEFVLSPEQAIESIEEFDLKKGRILSVSILNEMPEEKLDDKTLKHFELQSTVNISGIKHEKSDKLTVELIEDEWFVMDVPF